LAILPTAAAAAPPPDENAVIQAQRQWHAGVDVGYSLGSFAPGDVSGFLAGLHLAYGVSDAFNLRLQFDMSPYDLPEPATSSFVYQVAFGAEYLIDVLEWVPYVGLVSGPAIVVVQDTGQVIDVAIEPLFGLGYRLSSQFTVGAEVRFRQLFLFAGDTVPAAQFSALGRFEYTWVY
jgi:hypothetical protein